MLWGRNRPPCLVFLHEGPPLSRVRASRRHQLRPASSQNGGARTEKEVQLGRFFYFLPPSLDLQGPIQENPRHCARAILRPGRAAPIKGLQLIRKSRAGGGRPKKICRMLLALLQAKFYGHRRNWQAINLSAWCPLRHPCGPHQIPRTQRQMLRQGGRKLMKALTIHASTSQLLFARLQAHAFK